MAEKKTYRYSGPLSGVTLDDGTEEILHPGADIALPPENRYVKILVARKHLTEVEGEKEPGPAPSPSRKGRAAQPSAASEEGKQSEVEEATHAS